MLFNQPDPSKVPYPWGHLHPCNRLGIPNCILIGLLVFAQLTAELPCTLQCALKPD